jgi:SAM-dependent methyltransferase
VDNQARSSKGNPLLRLATDAEFRTRVVRFALGLPTPLNTEDRRLLEEVIIRAFVARPDIRTILFVGTDWYTRHYEDQLFAGTTLWTIDMRPKARRYGAKNHVVCTLGDAAEHFQPGQFDLIICNGVYGHGLNEPADCERSFDVCHSLLRAGGHFVLGWNDVPEHNPLSLESLESLKKFTPVEFEPLHAHRHLTNTPYRHTYQFFVKPPA